MFYTTDSKKAAIADSSDAENWSTYTSGQQGTDNIHHGCLLNPGCLLSTYPKGPNIAGWNWGYFTNISRMNSYAQKCDSPNPSDSGTVTSTSTTLNVTMHGNQTYEIAFYWNNGTYIGKDTMLEEGDTASVTVSGLVDGNSYNWYTVNRGVTDDRYRPCEPMKTWDEKQSNTWNFTFSTNNPSTQSSESPSNGSTGISLTPTLSVDVDDADDDTLTAYWYNSSSTTSSWWNNNWNYSKWINITNNEGETLSKGYPVNVTVDHNSWVTAGKSLASGDDVRILWYNSSSSTWNELDRKNRSAWNDSSTQIWFNLSEDISGGSYDDNYYVYYGNDEASNPPNSFYRGTVAMIDADHSVDDKLYSEFVKWMWDVSNYSCGDTPKDLDIVFFAESCSSSNSAYLKDESCAVITTEESIGGSSKLNMKPSGGTHNSITSVNIINNSHYITSPYSTGSKTIATSGHTGYYGGVTADIVPLITDGTSGHNVLTLAEAGVTIENSDTVEGNRVAWFLFSETDWINDANLVLEDLWERSFEWAADQDLKPSIVLGSEETTGGWSKFATNSSIDTSGGSVTIQQTNSNFSSYSTKYCWRVSLTDGTDWTNETYHFQTAGLFAPTQAGEIPANGSTGISLTPTLSVDVDDADDDTLDAYWYSNSSGTASPNWYDTNFSYRKLITISGSQVDATLTNFPILVNTTSDSDLNSNAQSDGDDIFFVLYSDNSTKLNHEIEYYNSGSLNAWVNVTSLSGSSDTKIWMCYGNSTCGSQENVVGTWNSDYVAVWHMNGSYDGTSGEVLDSTSNDNDGFSGSDGDNPTSQATGIIGYGQDFEETNTEDIEIPYDSSLDVDEGFTLSAWINMESVDPGTYNQGPGIMVKDGDDQPYEMGIKYDASEPYDWGGQQEESNGNDHSLYSSSDCIYLNTWYYLVYVDDGSTGKIIRNGFISDNSYDTSGWTTHQPGSGVLEIGNAENTAAEWMSDAYFDGIIDEVRISDVARNDSWINTTHNTISDNSNFMSFGSEVGQTTGGWSLFGTNSSIDTSGGSVTIQQTNSNFSSCNTKYWWRVSLTDGTDWTNETYHFQTAGLFAPTQAGEIPANDSTNISLTWDVCLTYFFVV